MELDPLYCDVIVRRFEALTGRRAVLDGDGRAFESVAAERGAATAVEGADAPVGGGEADDPDGSDDPPGASGPRDEVEEPSE